MEEEEGKNIWIREFVLLFSACKSMKLKLNSVVHLVMCLGCLFSLKCLTAQNFKARINNLRFTRLDSLLCQLVHKWQFVLATTLNLRTHNLWQLEHLYGRTLRFCAESPSCIRFPTHGDFRVFHVKKMFPLNLICERYHQEMG